jgi:hypothetical protein
MATTEIDIFAVSIPDMYIIQCRPIHYAYVEKLSSHCDLLLTGVYASQHLVYYSLQVPRWGLAYPGWSDVHVMRWHPYVGVDSQCIELGVFECILNKTF